MTHDFIHEYIGALVSSVYSEIITRVRSYTTDKLYFTENGIIGALYIALLLPADLLFGFLLFCVVAPEKYEHHRQEDQPVEEPENHSEGDDLEEGDEGVRLGKGQEDERQKRRHTAV